MRNLIYPVILAGGSGTRLWPRSREKSPKQFIQLIKGKSLFQETCLRFSNNNTFGFITIITNKEHRFLVLNQLRELGINNACIITEPTAKNTASACISGAYFLKKIIGNVPILFSPADHIISHEIYLFEELEHSMPFVMKGSLCIFGIKPTSPNTGYGYITKGENLGNNIYRPLIFIEKPKEEQAKELIKKEALWNSGLYFCTTETLIEEASCYIPQTQTILEQYFSHLEKDMYGFYVINENVYASLESISIDKAITEKTKKIILIESNITWSDLGSWKSLHTHFEKDEDGNVIHGDTLSLQTKNSYLESTSRLVAVLGLENIGVVETPDAILVFSLKESESIKNIVQKLTLEKRTEVDTHTKVERPWGDYEILGKEEHFQSKKITVLPGCELSLQKHKRRAEHWIVVQGIATVTRDNEIFELKKNESTFLPMGSIHRLQNKHDEILHLIEVQTGDYFGEDDIERFQDSYGR